MKRVSSVPNSATPKRRASERIEKAVGVQEAHTGEPKDHTKKDGRKASLPC